MPKDGGTIGCLFFRPGFAPPHLGVPLSDSEVSLSKERITDPAGKEQWALSINFHVNSDVVGSYVFSWTIPEDKVPGILRDAMETINREIPLDGPQTDDHGPANENSEEHQ